ncbi:MAG: CatB-related O-acetyltransferase [Candidatus Omnitrophica bacterium]|nr:CatB-related O-acetyltransferase [Candidatus Omnitrophota bacterium]
MIKNYISEWSDPKFNNTFAEHVIVCKGAEVKNSTLGYYSRLKNNVEFRSSTLGDYSVVNSCSIINTTDVGKFNSIGPGVYSGLWEHNDQWVSTHSFYLTEVCGGFVKGFKNFDKDEIRVTIGHDVWIGANVVILKGVDVGHGAILGAGTVVTKDVPPYAIVVGNPGRVMKYRFDQGDIDFLLDTQWWDFERDIIQQMVDEKVWDSLEKVKKFCQNL